MGGPAEFQKICTNTMAETKLPKTVIPFEAFEERKDTKRREEVQKKSCSVERIHLEA